MPELPDVETFRRLVSDHCRGRVVDEVAASDPGILDGISPDILERRLNGRGIRSAERHGKHLLIVFEGVGTLAMHFGTNGSLQLVPKAGSLPASMRVQLRFAEGDSLAYVNPRRLGRVSLCDGATDFAARSGLGPDVLDASFTLESFISILGRSRRHIKSLLMDQKLMAGIGNIYSDEVLFQARIHPGTAAAALSREAVSMLFRTMRQTLETAIRCAAGSEHTAERLLQGFLLPHRHSGGRCPRCGTLLAAMKHGGRTSYYCPRCQPAQPAD
jgi:formamidopyrimidine-DNA glycosylase